MEQYTSQSNIPSEARALIPSNLIQMRGGEEFQAAGEKVLDLGIKLQQIKEARETAQGIAQYNELVNNYVNTLSDKDPKDYDFVENYKKLNNGINKIYRGKSKATVSKLKNQFTVWDETNRAGIAKMSIDKSVALAKQELADVFENAVNNFQPEQAKSYLEDLKKGDLFTDREVSHFESVFQEMYDKKIHEMEVSAVFDEAMQMDMDMGESHIMSSDLKTADKRKILSDFKLEKEYIERKNNKLNENIINDTLKKASEGMSPSQFKAMLDQTVGLEETQKLELMQTFNSASRIYNTEGVNPFTTTMNYEKLTQDMVAVGKGEIASFDELLQNWRSGENGSPAYGLNYFQMLDNQRKSMMTDDEVLPRSHELVQYYGDIVDGMFKNEDDKVSPEDSQEYAETKYRIVELARQYINKEGGIAELEKELVSIVGKKKEEKAKQFLGEFLNLPGGGPVFRNPSYTGGQRGRKPELKMPEPKTQAEYDAIPKGTQYKHPDGTVRIKQ